ncbi:MAG: dockerin type I domain-containing protein, partial [Planctomycetota bacterium]
TDENWDLFSVQWDGWINIPVDGTRLQTSSDDGSRLWVDVNGDGAFASDESEFWDNGWGQGHSIQAGALTDPLPAGSYQIRMQYEEGTGGNAAVLDWITPDLAGQEQGYGHGPVVVGMSVQPGTAYEGPPLNRVEVRFSGALAASTLSSDSFQIRFSEDPLFFDGNDQILFDADDTIEWNASERKAIWEGSSNLAVGFYRVELDGDSDGIRSTAGQLLDGEFLNSYIPGNTTAPQWAFNPSGNGIPGGDYVALFSVSGVALGLDANPGVISERNGIAEITLTRSDSDAVSRPLTVQLSSIPAGRINLPSTVTIPANQESVTFTVSTIDNSLVEGDVSVTIRADAEAHKSGEVTIVVEDYEPITFTSIPDRIPENEGVFQVTLNRPSAVGDLVVQIGNDNDSDLAVAQQVVIPDGSQSITFEATVFDNAVVDGTRYAQLSADAPGYIGASHTLQIDDYEALALDIAETELRESDGETTATVTRTDPNGVLVVTLASSAIDEATVPSSITIPDGQLVSEPFLVQAVADGVGDGRQDVVIQAAAAGYVADSKTIAILDDETLEIIVDESVISENAGETLARIRRRTSNGRILVQLASDDESSATVPEAIEIADGAFESESFLVSAVDNNTLDGLRVVTLSATATDYFPHDIAIQVTDYEQLQLTNVGADSISENNGQTTFVVRRVDTQGDLMIRFDSSDESELAVPGPIEIPDGQLQSEPFLVGAADDTILDGTQQVALTAVAEGYIATSALLNILDEEYLSIAADSSSVSESGGEITLTIQRLNTDPTAELTVELSVSDDTELSVPSSVVFAPFETSKLVTATGVDDAELDGVQTVTVTAQALGYVSTSADIDVDDYEALIVEVAEQEIRESDGTTVGIVRRPQAGDADLVVTLRSSDTTEAIVPASVTIPAGQLSEAFTIDSVDDAVLDGDIRVEISASSAIYDEGVASLTVTDVEELVLTFEENQIREEAGVFTRATLSRHGDMNQSLVVRLSSDPAGAVHIPQAVTIPAGSAMTQFNVRPIYNSQATGNLLVEIDASAAGFTESGSSIEIIDVDPVGLSLNPTSVSELDGAVMAVITRAGTSGEATFSVSVDQPSMVEFPSEVTIADGNSTVEFEIRTLDNDLLDGNRDIDVAVQSSTYVGNTSQLSISDHETLSLVLGEISVSESVGQIDATVSRNNTDISLPLLVQLSSDDETVIRVPETVTIPAGEMSLVFQLDVLDDRIVEAESTVGIEAAADGYIRSESQITITDDDIFSWTNYANRFDVNNDGTASPLDALIVINELNRNGSRGLPKPETDPGVYFDVNEDEFLSPIDALMVINHLNQNASGEGERDASATLLATDVSDSEFFTAFRFDKNDDEDEERALLLEEVLHEYWKEQLR